MRLHKTIKFCGILAFSGMLFWAHNGSAADKKRDLYEQLWVKLTNKTKKCWDFVLDQVNADGSISPAKTKKQRVYDTSLAVIALSTGQVRDPLMVPQAEEHSIKKVRSGIDFLLSDVAAEQIQPGTPVYFLRLSALLQSFHLYELKGKSSELKQILKKWQHFHTWRAESYQLTSRARLYELMAILLYSSHDAEKYGKLEEFAGLDYKAYALFEFNLIDRVMPDKRNYYIRQHLRLVRTAYAFIKRENTPPKAAPGERGVFHRLIPLAYTAYYGKDERDQDGKGENFRKAAWALISMATAVAAPSRRPFATSPYHPALFTPLHESMNKNSKGKNLLESKGEDLLDTEQISPANASDVQLKPESNEGSESDNQERSNEAKNSEPNSWGSSQKVKWGGEQEKQGNSKTDDNKWGEEQNRKNN